MSLIPVDACPLFNGLNKAAGAASLDASEMVTVHSRQLDHDDVSKNISVMMEYARRIGVVDDHETSVIGLSAMISETTDLAFAGGAGTVDELLAITTDLDLAVLDLRLGDGTSPRNNVEKLRSHGIETLVYTSAEEAFLVRSAAAAGVLGVVRKSTRAADVLDAIRAAARGEQVATMDWAAAIDADADFVDVNLSPRQRQVLELYAAGEPAARVASVTGLSGDTVNQYLGRIRQKYAAAGRPAPTKTDLYKRAVEDGWLPMPRRFRH